jgi:hypothetical protein
MTASICGITSFSLGSRRVSVVKALVCSGGDVEEAGFVEVREVPAHFEHRYLPARAHREFSFWLT